MKFETTDNCILARLSREDMAYYELTCDDFRYAGEKTQAVITRILNEADKNIKNSLNEIKKMKIEVLPDCSGGCLIMFLPCGEQAHEFAVYETTSIDDLLDLAFVLKAENTVPEFSDLYEKDGLYRLTVKGASERAGFLLGEYLTPLEADVLTQTRLRETFRCIAQEDALKILGGALS